MPRELILKAAHHFYYVPGTMLNSLLPTSFFANVIGILHLHYILHFIKLHLISFRRLT